VASDKLSLPVAGVVEVGLIFAGARMEVRWMERFKGGRGDLRMEAARASKRQLDF
jgi:hypothetical protein